MSLMPNKSIRVEYSLLGIGAELLKRMKNEDSVSSLWDRVRSIDSINSYQKFIDGLTLLHAFGLINYEEGVLVKLCD